MTVYSKLANARVKLQETDIKKSGFNKFSKFKYYELSDFLPSLNKINMDVGILPIFNMNNEKATLKIVNCDKPEEFIDFEIPFVSSEVKGANAVQNLGGTETYLRRYLFLAAYEITDGEVFDALPESDKLPEKQKKQEIKNTEEIKVLSEKQLSCINSLITKTKSNRDKIKEFYQVFSLSELSSTDASKLIKQLKEKEEKNN